MMGGVLVRARISFCLAFALMVIAVGELRAQGFLIPDTTRRDMVFDFAGHNLYISTSTGLIRPLIFRRLHLAGVTTSAAPLGNGYCKR